MLLGCCHCNQGVSDSTPPSESSPSNSDIQSESNGSPSASSDDFYGCVSCISSIAPKRWLATINYTGTDATHGLCCSAYNQATYILFHVPNTCIWDSVERAKVENNVPVLTCVDGTGVGDIARVRLELTGTKLRLDYRLLYPTAGSTPSRARWEKNASAVSPINCLTAHTLNIQLNPFVGAWTGRVPCTVVSTTPATAIVVPI